MERDDIDLFMESAENSFEMQMIETLLVEELAARRAEVFENVVFQKKKRYYIENLTVRDYSLEHTTPYQIKIGDTVLEEHAWGALLCEVTKFLLNKYPKTNDELFTFSCHWTKIKMFTSENRTNHKLIREGLYLNCNQTALHSCWLLQNILDLFNIEKEDVYFLIHRPCGAEPAHVKEYIEKRFKNGFFIYLTSICQKDDDAANRIIDSFKHINKVLSSISRSYTNFFLFDDIAILKTYFYKVAEKILVLNISEKLKEYLIVNMALLVDYYKQ